MSIGTFVFEFATTGLARIAASAGAEFLVLDREHTGHGTDAVRIFLASARSAPIVPFVRVPAVDPHAVAAALDLGALGVMVPMVQNAEQARLVAGAARYPPIGRRGFGVLFVDEHGGDVPRYMEEMNREVAVIVQIESTEALQNVDQIAAVAGADVLWIGQYDLTTSLGIPGQFDHPDFDAALRTVVSACERRGKAAGMATDSVEDAERLLERGFRLLAYGHDITLYRRALGDGVARLRARRGPGA